MPRRLALLSLIPAMLGPAVVVQAAAGSIRVVPIAELCLGQAATITGTPGQDLIKGTEGSDVIITNGADEVDARGGDDLVCATGGAGDYGVVTISLGPGTDRLLGSSTDDELVFANDEGAGEVDRDIIHTRGGNDTVWTGGEATDTGVGEDVVALGAGYDLLKVTGPVSAANLTGGSGRDELLLWAERPPGVAVTIDNRHEEFSLGGEVVMTWRSFENFTAFGFIDGPFTFRGTSEPERLGNGVFFVDDRWKVDVRMGGGRDRVLIYGGAPGSLFDGGRGSDRLTNQGLGGSMYGRAGNDRLVGSDDGDDTLIGGRGYDVVDGGGGRDGCNAEVRIRCEA